MRLLITILTFTIMMSAGHAHAAQKLVAADDRIKTLVYDSSEVYRVVLRAGFQTQIEFNSDETIDTISIGDSIGWQLTPAGKRLFVKPLHKSGITNLSVITNRRAYQFELVATSSTSMSSNHSYVVKFYYPDSGNLGSPQIMPEDMSRGSLRPVSANTIPRIPTYAPPPAPIVNAPLPGESGGMSAFQQPASLNYNYTMSGPDKVAPLKIYDNGRSTFFQFGQGVTAPQIKVIGSDGQEFPLSIRSENGMAVVDAIAPKMSITQGKDKVLIFNENQPGY